MPTRYTTKSQPRAAVLRLNGGAARWNVTYVNIATCVKSTQKPIAYVAINCGFRRCVPSELERRSPAARCAARESGGSQIANAAATARLIAASAPKDAVQLASAAT